MEPEEKKRRLVALVAGATEQRLASRERKHSSCVAPGLGPLVLAKKLRAESLPDEAELPAFATRLVDWALGLEPERPFADADLEPSG